MRVKNSADELKHLRSCVNDLVSVTALPALWAGREPREIVKTLLEALAGMLRLDFVYARVDELVGVPFESVRFAGQVKPEVTPEEVGRALEGLPAWDAPAAVPHPAGEGEVRVAGFSLGLNRGNGHVVAASRRHDFPTDTEALLLRVAANQASLAIDNARLYELAQRERAAAEGARRQVADVLESITDSFSVYDREWRVTYFNREAEKLLPRLGLTREGALGKSIWELLPDLVGTVVYEQYQRAVNEQTPVEFEMFYPPLGGWYEVRAYPSKDGLAVYSQDITERKRAEEALRRSEQELADFFENAVVGLHWVGPDGTILRANRAELELLGYAAGEYVGHHIAEFHADRVAIADILRRLQAGEVLREYPARLRRKDGSVRQVLIDSSVLWEGDRFVHTRCFTRDVTERRRAEAEREMLLEREQALRAKAEEASRLKDEFLATVSHELRTPLTAIMGWAQMLEKTPLDSETARHAVAVIRRNADQQRQIVEDILEVSRAITGKLKLEPEPVEVGSLVQTALDSVGPSAKAKGIRLVSAFDPVAVVRGDPNRLRQVVWNLLANAVKFTP
ncbi:MAG TPA: PAS domain S-box protein, partial [Pyrinomonadaceae bacterium]